MSQGLREPTPDEINQALESVLLPRLVQALNSHEAGHCMRLSDLERDLIIRLCGALRSEVPGANVVILADYALQQQAPQFAVSSTKLVELRNPLPNDELRPPLLVFVPNEVRAAAEDSFGVATFEEISLDGVYGELRAQLLGRVPANIRADISACLARLQQSHWKYASDIAIVRFLLTAQYNDFDPQAFGAALFELGLVPDFELLAQPERAPARVQRNRDCVERLTWSTRSERARALELELDNPAFCQQLGEFFSIVGLDNPTRWTRQIVMDRNRWPLAFNKWEFKDGGINPDSIRISDVLLYDLPVVEEKEVNPKLTELIGQQILNISKTGSKKLSVSFRVDPVPSRVAGLAQFVAEVISRDAGPIGLRRRKSAWTKNTDKATLTFSSIGKIEWEEGWHFVRIYAETDDGERIPLINSDDNPLSSQSDATNLPLQLNESDLFYVLTDADVEIEPPQRAIPKELSLTHALYNRKFLALGQGRDPGAIAVSGCAWVERQNRSKSPGNDTLEVRLGKEGKANVLVNCALAEMERRFLAEPIGVNRLRLTIDASGEKKYETISFVWPISEQAQRFCAMREVFFAEVLRGQEKMIMQACNLLEVKEAAQNYAAAWVEWVEVVLRSASSSDVMVANRAFVELPCLLGIDTVAVVLHDYREQRREAVLLGPTHPLRVGWHAAWANLAQNWLDLAQSAEHEFIGPTRDAILKQLAPVGFPPVLPIGENLNRLFTATALSVDNINPFWSLYAAPGEADPRGLVGEVCAALDLAEPSIGGAQIDGTYLASRVQRYLVQHPYVKTLTINAFNPGRAAVLAEVLLALQKMPEFIDLRYDVRLFVPDPDAPITGEALIALLAPDTGTNGKGGDAFSTPANSHLYPKLRLAIRSLDEFRAAAQNHSAHLSFLFDVFPAEEIRASDASMDDESSFVHGLVQPFAVDYREDEQSITWLRCPLHGAAQPLEGAEELSDLLGTMARLFSVVAASISCGQSRPNARPVVALSLSPLDRVMLHQVHEVSDWVLTIDRNLGIEFFDHRRNQARPDYLIDHSPDMANAMSHRLAITSRSVSELEALLMPILAEYGLPCTGNHALVMLDQLRSLSGRLALKLLSSSTQRAEAMGLALSRLFLEHQGVFQNQVVVPLDAHLELYKALRQNAVELGDDVSFRRTDLALFDLDPATRTITCRLVEVKCYAQVGEFAAWEQLKASMAEQISQTEQVLAFHFDPHRKECDRPDRAIKNRDLAALLEFYLARAERYRVVLPRFAGEARQFLRRLDEKSYTLKFTRSAIVFDFSRQGTEAPDHEGGVEFYRIGQDLIVEMIEAAIVETESTRPATSHTNEEITQEITEEFARRRSLAPSIPALERAAFASATSQYSGEKSGLKPSAISASIQPILPGIKEAVSFHAMPQPAAPNRVEQERVTYEVEPVVQQGQLPAQPPPLPDPIGANVTAVLPTALPIQPQRQVVYDVMLGINGTTPQYGLLGSDVSGRKVALDLNQTHTISLFGVQGGGKSYTLGSIAEMASLRIPGINCLPEPLATVIFHYSPTMDYKPEFTSMVKANTVEDQVRQLRQTYGAEPSALSDVLLLVPVDKLAERRSEYPDIQVMPLQFSAAELKAPHWKFLMGAVGNQATYVRQMMRLMKSMRDDITLAGLRAGIAASSIPDHLKEQANARLDLASEYIAETGSLTELVRPGRLIIVDLRDEFIEKDEALGLFVVLLQKFGDAQVDGRSFNKLVVFDEAHKYIDSPGLVAGLIEIVREMRHKGVSVMIASQDPPSVPVNLIELSSQIILHKFNSPAWLKHIQKANAALANLTPERMAALKAGEAYVWSSKASDESYAKGAVKVRCRPRVTQHGGATKVAVKDE